MRTTASFATRSVFTACAALALSGCGTFDRTSAGIAGAITPYRIEVVQGNFVSKEQVAALQRGMSRTQARDILGTPLIADPFHKDRWDYVFTIRRQGVEPQQRRLALFFKDDSLERFEGDEMPTEADFVATLDSTRKAAKVPELQASEEKLRQFSVENKQPAAPPAPPAPATAVNYPPLEAPQR